MKVLVIFSIPIASGRSTLEFAMNDAAQCVAEAIPGAIVEGVRGEAREVLERIDRHAPSVVFNCCEAPLGRPDREHHVAALLEWIGVAFTGSGSECLALCRRKDRVNPLLAAARIRVPRNGGFPCIVKPADEDGSYGIWTGSICENPAELERARGYLAGKCLVEEFLPGREFVVSMWGARHPEHMVTGETLFLGGVRLKTYSGKWRSESVEFRNTPLVYDHEIAGDLRASLRDAAERAWHVVGARGYLNVDIRLDADGHPHVIDVNPNPELTPGFGIHRAVHEAGWEWNRFIAKLLEWAC